MASPDYQKMSSMHFYSWENGLKTGQYYLRSRPARDAIKFTVNIEELLKASDSGNNEELLKCLNQDNKAAFDGQQNNNKKRVGAPKTLDSKKRKLNDITN